MTLEDPGSRLIDTDSVKQGPRHAPLNTATRPGLMDPIIKPAHLLTKVPNGLPKESSSKSAQRRHQTSHPESLDGISDS